MNLERARTIVFFVLILLLIGAVVYGRFPDGWWKDVAKDVVVSSLSTVLCLVALWRVQSVDISALEKSVALLQKNMSGNLGAKLNRLERNIDLGEHYWLSFVSSASKHADVFWLVGNGLSRWRFGTTYSAALSTQLVERLKKRVSLGCEATDVRFQTVILVTEEQAFFDWSQLRNSLKARIMQELPGTSKTSCSRAVHEGMLVGLVATDKLKYTCIVSGEKMCVTPYTSSGRLEDSPSIEVSRGNLLWDLYSQDLDLMAGNALRWA